jgi:hypothetical protein
VRFGRMDGTDLFWSLIQKQLGKTHFPAFSTKSSWNFKKISSSFVMEQFIKFSEMWGCDRFSIFSLWNGEGMSETDRLSGKTGLFNGFWTESPESYVNLKK